MDRLMTLVRQQTSQPNPGSGTDIPSYHPEQSQSPEENHLDEDDAELLDGDEERSDEERDDGGVLVTEEEEDDEAESSDMNDENVRMTDLPTDMTNLSLNEDHRSASSGVNPDPRMQPTGSCNYPQFFPAPPMVPGHAIPSQSRQPFIAGAPDADPDHHHPLSSPMRYHRYGPSPTSPIRPRRNYGHGTTSDNTAFDFGGAVINGNPTVNIVHGVYEHVDRSSRILNIGSGNVTNTLIKDSNNDNSIQHSTAPGMW